MSRETIAPYDRGFREFSAAYEAFGFADIHRGALPFLPAAAGHSAPGLMLDVGAGSGRDADWFAQRGWEVLAVEPAAGMRAQARLLHPSPRIRWIDDTLPALAAVCRLGLVFDLVWLSGVWMHVAPGERARAMRKLAMLIKPGGRLVITLRHGPAPDDRPMWPVDAHEVERLGLEMGLALRVATDHADDLQGRAGVRWQTIVLDFPDDGAGALPLLRGVILRQEKSATYKLALLRCIARIADTAANVAREVDGSVDLPLGLVALTWLRMFKPLVERGLPQRPGDAMGFVKAAFRALAGVAPQDLRPGAVFRGDDAKALRQALSDAAKLIADMPARHLTMADGTQIFPAEYGKMPPLTSELRIDHELLWQYGTMHVPATIWHVMLRMSGWIEPMLIAEWVRLTKFYAARRGGLVTADDILDALRWNEPDRDTNFVRSLAQSRLRQGLDVTCVWSGRKLGDEGFDIDHCLPWSAWQCGDLWNLLPARRDINQRGKAGRIVAAPALAHAKPRILKWWQDAYLNDNPAVRARFLEEVRTTLPLSADGEPELDDIFQALDFRRLRLRQDTLIPEWAGASPQSQSGRPDAVILPGSPPVC